MMLVIVEFDVIPIPGTSDEKNFSLGFYAKRGTQNAERLICSLVDEYSLGADFFYITHTYY
jgi:hypothetical protein